MLLTKEFFAGKMSMEGRGNGVKMEYDEGCRIFPFYVQEMLTISTYVTCHVDIIWNVN